MSVINYILLLIHVILMLTLKSKTIFTVTEAAADCDKTPGRIAQLCQSHNLGQKINSRLRILSTADVAWLKAYFAESGKSFSKIARSTL